MPRSKYRAPGDQQIRAGLDHVGDGVVGNAPIDLDSEVEIKLGAELDQAPDLIQREADEFLAAKAWVDAHHQYMVNHGQDVDEKVDAGRGIDDDSGLHAVLADMFQGAVQVAADF